MSKTKLRHKLITALDLGTTKMCCFIAEVISDGSLHILGFNNQVSHGIRNGSIVDMNEVETSIRATVEGAEQMAKIRINDVVINISSGQPTSQIIDFTKTISGHEINDNDIQSILDYARHNYMAQSTDQSLIHSIPIGFTIDNNEKINDPHGMSGEFLSMTLHLISANSRSIHNLSTVVQRCNLDIETHVISAYASGLACVVNDERDLGVTCIDMGGGTTKIAMFHNGHLIHTDIITIGGAHVTNDIARVLSTSLVHAERIKTLYGNALSSPSDDHETLDVPIIGEEEDGVVNQITRSMLIKIIQSRLKETFESIRERITTSGFDKIANNRIILTGGGAQLQGICNLASTILNKQVRIGRPLNILGLSETTNGPSFSTCVGLMRYVLLHSSAEGSIMKTTSDINLKDTGKLNSLASWLNKIF
jgi:cell division protein FtsA